MTPEEEEHIRSICRAWMDFGFHLQSFLADVALKDVPMEIKEQIWDEESRIKKGA